MCYKDTDNNLDYYRDMDITKYALQPKDNSLICDRQTVVGRTSWMRQTSFSSCSKLCDSAPNLCRAVVLCQTQAFAHPFNLVFESSGE